MSSTRAQHYREQAEECRRPAERAKLDTDKAPWLTLSAQWQRMAEEADPATRLPTQQPQSGLSRLESN
jgi:hypothetical protein